MKIDPHKHKEKYLAWKEKINGRIPEVSQENSDILVNYIFDMEKGLNIAKGSVKGSRSYPRLNNLRQRMIFLSKKFEELYNVNNISNITEDQLISFFCDMKNGTFKTREGKFYKSVDTYANIFKAFWHWHQKSSKKKGIEVLDITSDLDTTKEKPKWVYLTEEQVKRLCEAAKYEYKVLFMFLFDTGIRSPTELLNVKVSDLYNDFKELQIREETSKTFGRRIKLMICSDLLKEYVKTMNLKPDDYLFSIKQTTANKYVKRLVIKLFGDGETEAGGKYSEISLYDFRHISCCYWLPRYKSESALKYRFGWKKSEKIHYYSELLGMKDTISEDDLLIDTTKTEIEKRLIKSEKDKEILQERLGVVEKQMQKILELMKVAENKIVIVEEMN